MTCPPHRWLVEEPVPMQPLMGAVCKRCGASRTYHKLIVDQYDYNAARVPETMHMAGNRRLRGL